MDQDELTNKELKNTVIRSTTWNMIPSEPGNQGKPGKIVILFRVGEKLGNLEKCLKGGNLGILLAHEKMEIRRNNHKKLKNIAPIDLKRIFAMTRSFSKMIRILSQTENVLNDSPPL